jgi:hypothetical protein
LVGLVVLTVCLPKIVTALQGGAVDWSAEDIGMILAALGPKALQRGKEAPEVTPSPNEAKPQPPAA